MKTITASFILASLALTGGAHAQPAAGDIFWNGNTSHFWHNDKNWRVYDPDPTKRPNKIPDGAGVNAYIGNFKDGQIDFYPSIFKVDGKMLVAPNLFQKATGANTTLGSVTFDIAADRDGAPVTVVVRSLDQTDKKKAAATTLKFDVAKDNAAINVRRGKHQMTSAIELLDPIDITVAPDCELVVRSENLTDLPEILVGGAAQTLTKKGGGMLFLRTPNTKFDGKAVVEAGTLRVGAPRALGGAGDTTQVRAGATLRLDRADGKSESGVAFDYGSLEELLLNGNGAGGDGALASYTAKGENRFTGPITLETASSVKVSGALLLDGVIDDAGKKLALTKIGSGDLRLWAANTYGGLTAITNGRVTVLEDKALGTVDGATRIDDGTALAFESDKELMYTLKEELQLGAGGAIVNVKGNTSFAGPLKFGGGVKNSVIDVERDTLTISGAAGDLDPKDPSPGYVKRGRGKLRLNGVLQASAAPFAIEQGLVSLDGAAFGPGAPISIVGNSILEGDGELQRGIVAATPGARIRPLPGLAAPEVLAAASLAMSPGAFLEATLSGPAAGIDYGQIVLNGLASIQDARLDLGLAFAPRADDPADPFDAADRFVLIANELGSPIDGRLAGVAYSAKHPDGVKGAWYGGNLYRFAVSYAQENGRNDLVLTTIPSPGSLALVGLSVLVAARRRS